MTHRINPPRPQPWRPGTALPADACDSHAHVFAPAGVYAYAEHRPYTPADDTGLAAYRVMLEGIGVEAATGHIHTARRCRTKSDLVDWIPEVVRTEAGLNQVMMLNPARLYGFDTPLSCQRAAGTAPRSEDPCPFCSSSFS